MFETRESVKTMNSNHTQCLMMMRVVFVVVVVAIPKLVST
jgi:hypothetical protein